MRSKPSFKQRLKGAKHKMSLQVNIMHTFLATMSVLLVIGCGVPKADYEKMKAEKEALESEHKRTLAELDECKTGAEKLIGQVEKAYAEKNYALARQGIQTLYDKHPESPKNAEFKILLQSIEKEELTESKRK